MEPEIKAYLIKIVNTLSITLLWMVIFATAGIKYKWAFWESKFTTGNSIFYLLFIGSFIILLRYMIKKWSEPLNIPR